MLVQVLLALPGTGTIVNVIAIIIGSVIGLAVGNALSSRTRENITTLLGLFTLVMAATSLAPVFSTRFSGALSSLALVVVLLALVVGAVIGSRLGLEARIEQFGGWLRNRATRGRKGESGDPASSDQARSRFINGFVTSTLLFCIGPMAILGSINDGLGLGNQILLTKSLLDGTASIAFASALGVGVLASALPVALYQGGLTVLGAVLGGLLSPLQIDALSVAGGIVLLGLSIRLLDLKQIPVADLLPGVVLAPVFIWIGTLVS